MKNRYVILIVVTLLLFFGCINQQQTETTSTSSNKTTKICKNISTQTEYTEPECQNMTTVQESCAYKELEYTVTALEKLDLCSDKTLCTSYDASNKCAVWKCATGTTICRVNITNKDSLYKSKWTAIANYTLNSMNFDKNPVNIEIKPGETKTAEFQLFYSMDADQITPACKISVLKPSKIMHCANTSITRESCIDVIKYNTVITESCQ